MKKCMIIRFAAIVAVAVVVATSATLPLCAVEVAADEARRMRRKRRLPPSLRNPSPPDRSSKLPNLPRRPIDFIRQFW